MSRYIDPRAPTGLTTKQLSELQFDPEVQRLQKAVKILAQKVKSESGTITKAQALNTKLYQLH